MKNFNWEGVMPAITTQFDAEGNLSLEAFKNNLAHQIKAGVHGIILGGTLGEASTLTHEEKKILLDATLAEVDGKIPVIMNIAEQSTSEAVEVAKSAEANGANGLML
ncbi:MAG: dihydrodipicolinate synthase family protein, partial [Flavobacteriaceae bacterium]|nr:dihydrodipicolinate synthase family protein [Flavobacteriaceae bacterium]